MTAGNNNLPAKDSWVTILFHLPLSCLFNTRDFLHFLPSFFQIYAIPIFGYLNLPTSVAHGPVTWSPAKHSQYVPIISTLISNSILLNSVI